jgi:hypothetical protein
MQRSRLALVAVIGALSGACAVTPDVVATNQTLKDASAPFVTPISGCYAGLYRGRFNNSPTLPSLFPVTGEIEFRLVPSGGEFLTVESGAKLSGRSDQGNQFFADIDDSVDGGRGGCYEGQFQVELTHGKYYPAGEDAASGYDFFGTVEGSYQSEEGDRNAARRPGAFFGTWKTFSPLLQPAPGQPPTPISQGDWQALWYPSE